MADDALKSQSMRRSGTAIIELERQKKIFRERFALSLAVGFCTLVAISVWYTQGKILDPAYNFLAGFAPADALASRNAAANCQDPRNKSTPYCQDRKVQTDADWRAISSSQGAGTKRGGSSTQFTLHGKQ